MILRPSRQRRGEDPHLQTRMLIFAGGAVIALTGIATNRGWLIWIAIAVLAVGALMRFFRGANQDHEDSTDQHDENE